VYKDFLVPTRQRGNAVSTRQRRVRKDGTLARHGMDSHAGAWEPEKPEQT